MGIAGDDLPPPRQPRQPIELPADQGFSLCPTPTLHLLLERECLGGRLELAAPNKADRPTMTRVLRTVRAVLVLPEARFDVVGAADVVRAVGALEDVDV